MDVNNGLPAIQFFVYGFESFIAQVFVLEARHQTNTVSLQCIHCILDLTKTALSVGKWNGGKETESAPMVGDHLRSVLVAFACQPARILDST